MFLENRWTTEKIRTYLDAIRPMVFRRSVDCSVFRLRILESEDAAPFAGDGSEGRELPVGTLWGLPRMTFVLSSSFRVPEDWKQPAVLHIPLGDAGSFNHPEALAYVDGEPWSSIDRFHHEIPIDESWCDGEEHCLDLHGWTGGVDQPPIWSRVDPDAETGFLQMKPCRVVEIHQETRDLVSVFSAALGVVKTLDNDSQVRASLLHAMNGALQLLDTRSPLGEAFYESVPGALHALEDDIARSGAPLNLDMTAAGHAHIDVAWLWTLQQARQKTRRSFSNVLQLMEEYPDFVFVQSQAQLYEYIRQDDPKMFASIQEHVRLGVWEPVGGMWVEADSNLIGPESMVRQFLLGSQFFDRHLGCRSRVLWMPDVFGFSWSLPQLACEAGMKYMFTTKMGWNEYNYLPFESFWWQGLDGSRLLTHFSPIRFNNEGFPGTYNAHVSPEEVAGSWKHTFQKEGGRVGQNVPQLMCFGYGDGGGGPTRQMLENIRLFENFPGVPRVKPGTAAGFFEELESDFGSDLPFWNGELYLEYHRGTYTSQARIKQDNRRSEYALHNAEFLGSAAAALDPDFRYPVEELRKAWHIVCLNQFHDILPGSSIHEVYVEAAEDYREARGLAESALDGAMEALAGRMGGELLLANPTGFTVRQPVWVRQDLIPDIQPLLESGSAAMQSVQDGVLLDLEPLPPYSIIALDRVDSSTVELESDLSVSETHMENSLLRLEFTPSGDLVRIYDKELDREVLAEGRVGNELQLFEDRPAVPEAWDISIYYDDRMWLPDPAESVELQETGPLRAAVRIQRRFRRSTITQEIRLWSACRRIDFATEVDWQERRMMLKAAFPVEILSPKAEYEIQWGSIERPTHRNTSWDFARFEVPAQKWVDLSEGGYGVSLLNDSKYGHDVHDNVMRLSLLRAPDYPDPEADRGQHRFCYSLLPHPGSRGRETAAQAYALNDPVVVHRPEVPGDVRRRKMTLIQVDDPRLIVETIKPAEDGRGLIVRLYDFTRGRGKARISCALPVESAWRTTILEEDQFELEKSGSSFSFDFSPFEVISLRLITG